MISRQDRKMKTLTKRIITSFILIGLIIPTTLFSLPQKAEAQAGGAASCLAGYAAAALSALTSIPQNILGVPKSQVGDTTQNVLTGGSANALSFNNCILRPIGKIIIITLIRNIGSSIVNWVNSGFQGNPTFITDFEGMLTDTADQAIGTFIEGSDLGFLCNDFGFQIRIALALKYSQPFREQARCTLSDIGENISTNGGRGWDNLLAISTEPQNNVYGAYFIAETELAQRAAKAVGIKEKRVAIGQGFLDFETCDRYETTDEVNKRLGTVTTGTGGVVTGGGTFNTTVTSQNANSFVDPKSNQVTTQTGTNQSANAQCLQKTTKTPGTVIAGKINSTFAQGDIQQAVAQEIDQVIAATLNQLAQKVIQGAYGLLGLSKKRSSSQSYLSRYQSQFYGTNSGTGIPTDTGATSEIQDYQIGSYDEAGALLDDTSDPNMNAINTLFNNTVNAATTNQQEQIVSISDSLDDTANNTNSNVNVSILKPVSQSSGTNPSAANDGITTTSSYSSGSATAGNDANPWWQVDLGEIKKIKEVRIWAVSGKPASQTLETFRVVIGGGSGEWSSSLVNAASAPNPIIVPVNQSGSTVRIEKMATPYQCSRFEFDEDCYHPLELAEVQVMEDIAIQTPSTNTSTNTSGTNTNSPTIEDSRTGTSTLSWTPTSPVTISVSSSKPLNQELRLGAEKTASGVTVEIGLYRNGVRVPFHNVFNTDFDILRGATNGSQSSSQSVITSSTGAIRFKVSVNSNSAYSFKLKGSVRAGAPSGGYSFEVRVSDSTETELPDKSHTTSFSL